MSVVLDEGAKHIKKYLESWLRQKIKDFKEIMGRPENRKNVGSIDLSDSPTLEDFRFS